MLSNMFAIKTWTFVILFACLVYGQRKPPNYQQNEMPPTSFSCKDKIVGGYYADPETSCQMFHVCVNVVGTGVQDFRFLCPNDTAFDQENQICDDWYNIDCEAATLYYSDNFDLYKLGSGGAPATAGKVTPIPLGPSSVSPNVQQPKSRKPSLSAPVNNAVSENDDDYYLQRSDSTDSRLQHDLLRGSSSSNFFSNRNRGVENPDDYDDTARALTSSKDAPKKNTKAPFRKLLTGKKPIAESTTGATSTTETVQQWSAGTTTTVRQPNYKPTTYRSKDRGRVNYKTYLDKQTKADEYDFQKVAKPAAAAAIQPTTFAPALSSSYQPTTTTTTTTTTTAAAARAAHQATQTGNVPSFTQANANQPRTSDFLRIVPNNNNNNKNNNNNGFQSTRINVAPNNNNFQSNKVFPANNNNNFQANNAFPVNTNNNNNNFQANNAFPVNTNNNNNNNFQANNAFPVNTNNNNNNNFQVNNAFPVNTNNNNNNNNNNFQANNAFPVNTNNNNNNNNNFQANNAFQANNNNFQANNAFVANNNNNNFQANNAFPANNNNFQGNNAYQPANNVNKNFQQNVNFNQGLQADKVFPTTAQNFNQANFQSEKIHPASTTTQKYIQNPATNVYQTNSFQQPQQQPQQGGNAFQPSNAFQQANTFQPGNAFTQQGNQFQNTASTTQKYNAYQQSTNVFQSSTPYNAGNSFQQQQQTSQQPQFQSTTEHFSKDFKAKFDPYNSYHQRTNEEAGESLKTASSTNLRPSDLNSLIHPKPKSINATLSVGYSFNKADGGVAKSTVVVPAPTTQKPRPFSTQPAVTVTTPVATSSRAAVTSTTAFAASSSAGSTKKTVVKDKDSTYDYAYYDDSNHNDYTDVVPEDFSRIHNTKN